MKKITLLAIFLSSSIGLFSQTSLDSLLFKKINNYRNAHGLKSWEWDQNVWEASNSHNKYLMDLGRLTHYQEGSDSTYTGGDRLIQQGVTWYLTRENCAMRYRYDNETDEEQSEKILLQWINSPGHNETLLCSKSKYGAVSTTHGTKLKSYTDARRTYATLNVYI